MADITSPPPLTPPSKGQGNSRFLDSDLFYSFLRSKLVVAAAVLTALLVGASLLAPLIAPHDPYDLRTLELINSDLPPAWQERSDRRFLLGTDDQGRDILSTILYGTRSSLLIGIASVLLAVVLGVTLGLWAGYAGGRVDSAVMRIADVQLTFPAILTALLIDGVALAIFRNYRIEGGKFWILVIAIGLAYWVQYARTVRGVTLVERNKEYVEAARLIGLSPLGTMIQVGNKYLFSGSWWMVAFPGVTLALLALAVNVLGDWLRDALNPKLR
jgi:peptide/nickel transport system permease protein